MPGHETDSPRRTGRLCAPLDLACQHAGHPGGNLPWESARNPLSQRAFCSISSQTRGWGRLSVTTDSLWAQVLGGHSDTVSRGAAAAGKVMDRLSPESLMNLLKNKSSVSLSGRGKILEGMG